MPTGISIHLGLNSIDPAHYGGSDGVLKACEADAKDMERIAKAKGFTTQLLLTKKATRSALLKAIAAAAKQLKKGDILLVTYSGHGGQLPDLDGDEDDNMDETWCLYDGQVVDDEIYLAFSAFAAGVRILVFLDSCHSGSATKVAFFSGRPALCSGQESTEPVYRMLPPDVALRTYEENQAFYDPILTNKKLKTAQANVKASSLLISGCQDNQLSADGTFNGLFTGKLRKVWNNGKFKKGYRGFWKSIVKLMPPEQTPNYYTTGAHNAAFEAQTPFTI